MADDTILHVQNHLRKIKTKIHSFSFKAYYRSVVTQTLYWPEDRYTGQWGNIESLLIKPLSARINFFFFIGCAIKCLTEKEKMILANSARTAGYIHE